MPLRITTRDAGGVSIVSLDGRIVLGEESNALREKVRSLLSEGKKGIVLNLENVTYIDSPGLGTLVAAHHSAGSRGAALKLSGLGSKFQELLQITKLLTVFDVFESVPAAVESFSPNLSWSVCPIHGRFPGIGDCPKCPPGSVMPPISTAGV
jgi:anti-sigma B factor antagonist